MDNSVNDQVKDVYDRDSISRGDEHVEPLENTNAYMRLFADNPLPKIRDTFDSLCPEVIEKTKLYSDYMEESSQLRIENCIYKDAINTNIKLVPFFALAGFLFNYIYGDRILDLFVKYAMFRYSACALFFISFWQPFSTTLPAAVKWFYEFRYGVSLNEDNGRDDSSAPFEGDSTYQQDIDKNVESDKVDSSYE